MEHTIKLQNDKYKDTKNHKVTNEQKNKSKYKFLI